LVFGVVRVSVYLWVGCGAYRSVERAQMLSAYYPNPTPTPTPNPSPSPNPTPTLTLTLTYRSVEKAQMLSAYCVPAKGCVLAYSRSSTAHVP
jgi:hypothetical protein